MPLKYLDSIFWTIGKGAVIGQLLALAFVVLACEWQTTPQGALLMVCGHPLFHLISAQAREKAPWITVAFIMFAAVCGAVMAIIVRFVRRREDVSS
jgi:hypothetical protein